MKIIYTPKSPLKPGLRMQWIYEAISKLSTILNQGASPSSRDGQEGMCKKIRLDFLKVTA